MRPRGWEPQQDLTFEELVASLYDVLGEAVIVEIWNDDVKQLEGYGRLKDPFQRDDGTVTWRIGDHQLYLSMNADSFSGGTRSAHDGDDWNIGYHQGRVKVIVLNDKNEI